MIRRMFAFFTNILSPISSRTIKSCAIPSVLESANLWLFGFPPVIFFVRNLSGKARGPDVLRGKSMVAHTGWKPVLQGNQLQAALHFCRHTIAMIKTSAYRRDVRWPQSNSRSNEIIIAKDAVGRVQSDPTSARQKNFRPRMQRTFRAANFFVRLMQIPGNDSRRQASLPQNFRQQHRRVTTGPTSQTQCFSRRLCRPFFAPLVGNCMMQELR